MSEHDPRKDLLKSLAKAGKAELKAELKAEGKALSLALKRRLEGLSPAQREALLARLGDGSGSGLPRAPRAGDEAVVSFAQQRLWFMDQLTPEDPSLVIVGALRLEGSLSPGALARAIDHVVARHEPLRASFVSRDGAPAQRVHPPGPVPFRTVDLADLPQDLRRARARALYAEEASTGMALDRAPLVRVTLLREAQDDHLLIIAMHHIASDGWSIRVFMRDLAASYVAFRDGGAPTLAPLPNVYADFAAWQRARLEEAEEGLAWWRAQLAEVPPGTVLADDGGTPGPASAGDVRTTHLSGAHRRGLEALAREADATLFVTLLCAFVIVLARCADTWDVVLGTPVSGRSRVETEGMVGLFLNNLVLRVRLAPEMSFREALAATRAVFLETLRHAEVPFERVVEAVAPERSGLRMPFFDTFFNFTPRPVRTIALPGLRATFEDPPINPARFGLELYVLEREDGLDLELLYATARYGAARMDSLLAQILGVLETVVAAPDSRIGELPLGATAAPVAAPLGAPPQEPVPRTIAEVAARAPGAPAIVQGAYTLSYAQLVAGMLDLVEALEARGVAPGDVVAVEGPPSPGVVVAMAAVLLHGGVLLTLSADLPPERRARMLDQVAVAVTIRVGSEGELGWPARPEPTPSVDVGRLSERLGRLGDAGRRDPAYLFFTSGSTGTPKGVLGTRAGLAHFLAWQRGRYGVGPGHRCAQLVGLSFDVVLRDVFLPLTSGATLVIPDGVSVLDGAAILRWLDREGVTHLHTVPSVLEAWLAAEAYARDADGGRARLDALQRMFVAGEPLTASLVARWRAAFPDAGAITNLYGPTETTLARCYYDVPAQPSAGVQPVGVPIPNTEARVLRPDLAPCGVGEPGQIVLRTPFRTLGYVNGSASDAARWVHDPRSGDPDDLLYLTGDRGRLRADGCLEFCGRMDHQVKLRGVRVEPDEIAATLQAAPGVASAAVVVRDDGPTGPTLVAYVVLAPGSSPNTGELLEFLRPRLLAAMLPGAFVFLDRLPLNANHKLDRGRLPAPDYSRAVGRPFVAPRDEREAALVRVWEEILKISPIGVTDSFFEVGGHSLLALKLLVTVERRLGWKIPVDAFFLDPTVAHLADVGAPRSRRSPLLVELRPGTRPERIFLVHPGGGMLWSYRPLVRHLGGEHPVVGVQARGLDGTPPHADVGTMADAYVDAIRGEQPRGPYLLVGHSFGGLVAHAMALRLRAAGQRVALLALLDTVLDRPDEPEDGLADRLVDTVRTIARVTGLALDLPRERLAGLGADAAVALAQATLAEGEGLPFRDNPELLPNVLRVSAAHVAARKVWQPPPSDLPVTLLRASEGATSPDLGWGGITTSLRRLDAAGDHVGMLLEPAVEVVGGLLRAEIASALSDRA